MIVTHSHTHIQYVLANRVRSKIPKQGHRTLPAHTVQLKFYARSHNWSQ